MKKINVSFILNGEYVSLKVSPLKRLIDVLREDFNLTGAKESCGEGECGSCSVLINGRSSLSCLITIASVEGKTIETIEYISDENHPSYYVVDAFIKEDACQCGYCIPGFVVTVADYQRNKHKAVYTDNLDVNSDKYIKRMLSGNLCRCTGYEVIMGAVHKSNEDN